MARRKTALVEGEYYHIYNRGVDKRPVFMNLSDYKRFFKSVIELNTLKAVGGLHVQSFKNRKEKEKLVAIVAYCFNPNHYHFILTPKTERGIEKFMQRLGTGYTNYFNKKYKRTGSLFQGKYKSSHIRSNEKLKELSAYVSLNYRVHTQLRSRTSKLGFGSSWGEYIGDMPESVPEDVSEKEICEKDIVLGQFKSKKDYKKFAEETVKEIVKRRKEDEELDKILID